MPKPSKLEEWMIGAAFGLYAVLLIVTFAASISLLIYLGCCLGG